MIQVFAIRNISTGQYIISTFTKKLAREIIASNLKPGNYLIDPIYV